MGAVRCGPPRLPAAARPRSGRMRAPQAALTPRRRGRHALGPEFGRGRKRRRKGGVSEDKVQRRRAARAAARYGLPAPGESEEEKAPEGEEAKAQRAKERRRKIQRRDGRLPEWARDNHFLRKPPEQPED